MRKKEFLDLLKLYLKDLPTIVVNDILEDYEEHFSIGIEKGKTEEQVCEELGSPEAIAREYTNDSGISYKNYANSQKDTVYKTESKTDLFKDSSALTMILAIIGLVIIAPPLFGVVMGIIGALIGLVAVVFSLGIAAIAIGISSLLSIIPGVSNFPFISMPDFAYSISPITRTLVGVAMIPIGILVFYFMKGLVVNLIAGIKKVFIAIIWQIEKWRYR